MEKRRLRIIYSGEIDDALDRCICGLVEKELGGEWWAQGYNLITNRRDICFDIPSKEN